MLLSVFLSAAIFSASAPIGPPANACVQDDSLETRLERLGQELEAQRTSSHVSGMAIAIVMGDEVIYARGFGLRDREQALAATPQTLFAIGSSTKAFTSALIGMQVDEGKLDWDDPVSDYLPDFKLKLDLGELEGLDAVVTIRDLLCHRTGFTRMSALWAAGLADRATILAAATRAEPVAPFREAFFYNNVMFLAAGQASGVVAEQGWDELVAARLFEPLGMGASDTRVEVAQATDALALGYQWDADKSAFERDEMRVLDSIAPAGAINSNVIDMAQWLRLQLGRGAIDDLRLISAESLEATWQPQIDVGDGSKYGMGWFLEEWNGKRVVQHGGNIDGFSAMVALLPDDDLGFVLLTNASQTSLQNTSREMVWRNLLGEIESSESLEEHLESEDFDDFVGTYIANYAQFDHEEFEVLVQNNRLALDIPSQRTFELLAPDQEGLRAFALAPAAIQASFQRDETGTAVSLSLFQNGMVFEVPREGFPTVPDGTEQDFARYFGTYDHPQLPEPIVVRYRDGRLVCDIPGQMVFELRLPNQEGIWSFRATDELGLEFQSDADDSITGLIFHERGTTSDCPLLERGSAELPTVEELEALRRSEVVSQRLDELGSMRLNASLRMLQSGIEGSTVSTFKGSDHFLTETSLGAFGWTQVGLAGEKAWNVSAFEAIDEPTGQLLEQTKLTHPAVLFSNWSRFFLGVKVLRETIIEDQRLIVVSLSRGDLPAWEAFVDPQTGDVARLNIPIIVPNLGTVATSLILSDYRDVQGLRIPHRVEAETPFNGRTILTYGKIEVDLDLPETFFRPRED